MHFIRHGETAYHGMYWIVVGEANGYMLNERGIQQVRDLGWFFCKQNTTFDVVVSSTTPRSMETANILFPGKVILASDKIRAKSAWAWEGKLKSEVYTQEYHENPYTFVPPGGESFEMVNARATSWLQEFVATHIHANRVAVITHDFVIKCLFCYLFDFPTANIENMRIDNTKQLIVEFPPECREWKSKECKAKLLRWN